VPVSLGRIHLINCVSASTPGLTPEQMLSDGILIKRPDAHRLYRRPNDGAPTEMTTVARRGAGAGV